MNKERRTTSIAMPAQTMKVTAAGSGMLIGPLHAQPVCHAACCVRNDIELNHHDALSDALACAKLYLLRSV